MNNEQTNKSEKSKGLQSRDAETGAKEEVVGTGKQEESSGSSGSRDDAGTSTSDASKSGSRSGDSKGSESAKMSGFERIMSESKKIAGESGVSKLEGKTINENDLVSPAIEIMTKAITSTEKKLSMNQSVAIRQGIILRDEVPQWINTNKTGQFRLIDLREAESIPTFVRLVTQKSSNVATANDVIEHRTGLITNPLIAKSYATFPPDTLTVRYEFNPNPSGIVFPDVNSVDKEQDMVKVMTVRDAKENYQKYTDTLVNKLMNLVVGFAQSQRIQLLAPSKDIFDVSEMPDEFQALIAHKTTVKDNPHPAWAGINHDIEYFRQDIINMINNAPPLFGERTITYAPNGVKIGSVWGLTVDAFMAKILSINREEMQEKQMNVQEFLLMLKACNMNMFQDVVLQNPNNQFYPLITAPSPESINMFWMMMMMSKSAKTTAYNYLTTTVNMSNRFRLGDIEEAFNFLDNPNSKLDSSLLSAVNQLFSVGKDSDHISLLVLETLSGYFTYELGTIPSTDMGGNLIVIASLLAWQIVCPRLAQALRFELGRTLMLAIQNLIGAAAFIEFTGVYGWTRLLVNGRWQLQDDNSIPRYRFTRDVPDNLQPSIFTLDAVPNRGRNNLLALMTRISNFFNIRFHPVELEHKRMAGYMPYTNDDYMYNMSWNRQDLRNTTVGVQTHVNEQIYTMVGILNDLEQLYLAQQGRRRYETGTKSWFLSFKTALTNSATNAAYLLNSTLADLQYYIANSPLCVHDGAINVNNTYPDVYGLGANPEVRNEAGQQLGRPTPIDMPMFRIDMSLPLRILLTGKSDIESDTGFRQKATLNPTENNTTHKLHDAIMPPDPKDMVDMYYSMLCMAEKMAIPLQFLYFLSDPNANDNPFPGLARSLRRAMIVRNWYSIMKGICEAAGTPEVFDLISPATQYGIKDLRYVLLRIVKMSKDPPGTLSLIQPNNSRINVTMDIMDRYAINKLNVLARLYIRDNSPFSNLGKGFWLGKLNLADRVATATENVVNEQYPTLIDIGDLTYRYAEGQNGTEFIIDFPNIGEIRSPYDKRIDGVQIVTDKISTIAPVYHNFLISAILDSKIMLKVKDKLIRYSILDLDSKLISYNESLSTDFVTSIFNAQDLSEMKHTFLVTEFANNFTRNEMPMPGYIQYFTMMEPFASNLLCAAITRTVVARPNYVALDPENWGLGPIQNDGLSTLMPISNVPKINSSKINMNNLVPALLTGAFEITPKIQLDTLNPYGLNI